MRVRAYYQVVKNNIFVIVIIAVGRSSCQARTLLISAHYTLAVCGTYHFVTFMILFLRVYTVSVKFAISVRSVGFAARCVFIT